MSPHHIDLFTEADRASCSPAATVFACSRVIRTLHTAICRGGSAVSVLRVRFATSRYIALFTEDRASCASAATVVASSCSHVTCSLPTANTCVCRCRCTVYILFAYFRRVTSSYCSISSTYTMYGGSCLNGSYSPYILDRRIPVKQIPFVKQNTH